MKNGMIEVGKWGYYRIGNDKIRARLISINEDGTGNFFQLSMQHRFIGELEFFSTKAVK